MHKMKLLALMAALGAFLSAPVLAADDEGAPTEETAAEETSTGAPEGGETEVATDVAAAASTESVPERDTPEADKPSKESIIKQYGEGKKELKKVFGQQLVDHGYAKDLEEAGGMLKDKKKNKKRKRATDQ